MAAVKALQQWCKVRCDGYRDVSITNMTTSFRDGLAFCALIHRHRPDLIDFDSLKKENVYENNKLAFKVAEEELGIPALLDAEDMVALKVPDRLSILTYVSQYYNYFHGRSPIGGMGGMKRPAESPAVERPGKKNQPVTSREFSSLKPAGDNTPPRSPKITRPFGSPKPTRNAKQISNQDVKVEKPHQTGTLSNKCVSCNKHVHLVQRHLVDGRLYHRSCMRLLSPTNIPAPLRDLPTNTPVSKFTSLADSNKTTTNTPLHTPPRPGPTWLKDKPNTPPSFFSSSPSRPAPSPSPAAKSVQTPSVAKTTTSWTPGESTFTTTPSVPPRPTPAPRHSVTVAKTLESKLKFFESDNTTSNEEEKTPNIGMNKGLKVAGGVQQASVGQTVNIVVNVGGTGRQEVNVSANPGGDKAKAAGVTGGETGKTSDPKAKAAAFISKKLAEETNDKPAWTTVVLKKTEKSSPSDTPKKEMEGVRGRVRLKADPSLITDLQTPERKRSPPSPALRSGLRTRTPDRGVAKPGDASPNTPASSENESPADWRSKLKPISKESKPPRPSAPPPNPWAYRDGKPQTPEPSVGPTPPHPISKPTISVTPPAPAGFVNGQGERAANGTKDEPKIAKTKPDYIRKEDIMKELQDIENVLNELEKKGVELEERLRRCDEDGEDDTLMVEWFSLIRHKQVAMRRESELVYIGRTQDLEEQQPSVEQELRRLMEKPEHLKTSWERKKEEQLIAKLLEIVNDRNAIVDGLDDDRLREEEEDEQLNKMLKDFNVKTEKTRKKSPMSRLFGWGSKKDG
ncbi:protein-methionine sulfoxide oxidase mical2b [Antennarius striatus]|uniref:protein-methionine sulfoxide oxidase mical2b n=1 Tax=Antennarius striatus TaxID=241820 RepID=UPI0035AF4F60